MRLLLPILILSGLIALAIQLWNKTESGGVSGSTTVISGDVQIGAPYRLTDKNSNMRQSSEFHGRYQLVFFGFTHCPDICPADLGKISLLMDKLGVQAPHVVPVFISLDPERDTPEVLSEYMQAFSPEIIALTGTKDEVAPVLKAFKIYASKAPLDDGGYTMDHSAFTYLMGRDGAYVRHFDHDAVVDDMLKDINARIAKDIVAGVTLDEQAQTAPVEPATPQPAPQDAAQGGLLVSDMWVREATGKMSAGYMTLQNNTTQEIIVTGANATAVGTIEIHETSADENGVMRMRPVGSVTVPAGQTVTLKPGGMHMMLMGLEQPLQAGATLPVILHIQDSPSMLVNAEIR